MADVLAGQRQAINEGKVERLLWPDEGKGAPVEVGQFFKLRSCHIEITRVGRVQARGNWSWRAEFTRIYAAEKPLYLRSGDGYTTNAAAAMRVQGDGTTISGEPRKVAEAPEPAIASHEVRTLPTSVAARARFESERSEITRRRLQTSLIEEIRSTSLSVPEMEEIRHIVREKAAA